MRKIIAFCLVLVMLITSFGCAGGNDPVSITTATTVTTVTSEIPPEPTTIGLINENGEAAYRIILPENRTEVEAKAGTDLNRSLKELTNTTFMLNSDFLAAEESVDDLADVCEILIGATNRPESVRAAEGLSDNEYVIRVDGAKIVIAGGSDAAIYKAMERFFAMIEESDGFTVSKDTSIKEEIVREPYLVALTNQGKSCLEVYDISEGKLDETSLVWSYELPKYNIAGTKFRHSEEYGDVALAVYGKKYACMISYPEGELLWSTSKAADNPHSIELLPNGVIAVASSDGREIRFFVPSGSSSGNYVASVTLADAHGVLWDDEKQILWAIGRRVLTAYRVTLDAEGNVSVVEDSSCRAMIPTDYAHDLAPVYGNTNLLWISTGSSVYQFNKTTKSFSTAYNGASSVNRVGVKGIGSFNDGSIVYIYPDGAFKTWTSQSMVLMTNTGGILTSAVLKSETGHFYKVRVWDTRYQ